MCVSVVTVCSCASELRRCSKQQIEEGIASPWPLPAIPFRLDPGPPQTLHHCWKVAPSRDSSQDRWAGPLQFGLLMAGSWSGVDGWTHLRDAAALLCRGGFLLPAGSAPDFSQANLEEQRGQR